MFISGIVSFLHFYTSSAMQYNCCDKLSHNIKSYFFIWYSCLVHLVFPPISHSSCLIANPHVIVTHILKKYQLKKYYHWLSSKDGGITVTEFVSEQNSVNGDCLFLVGQI